MSQKTSRKPDEVVARVEELKSEGRRTVMFLVTGSEKKMRFVSLAFRGRPLGIATRFPKRRHNLPFEGSRSLRGGKPSKLREGGDGPTPSRNSSPSLRSVKNPTSLKGGLRCPQACSLCGDQQLAGGMP